MDLHQTSKNSYINATENKHWIDNLPWWHSNYGEESWRNLNESRQSNISAPTPRFCKKSTGIQIGTKHKTRIFGGRNQFGWHDNVPPEGKIMDITDLWSKSYYKTVTDLRVAY